MLVISAGGLGGGLIAAFSVNTLKRPNYQFQRVNFPAALREEIGKDPLTLAQFAQLLGHRVQLHASNPAG
jgi:hypothetical protein